MLVATIVRRKHTIDLELAVLDLLLRRRRMMRLHTLLAYQCRQSSLCSKFSQDCISEFLSLALRLSVFANAKNVRFIWKTDFTGYFLCSDSIFYLLFALRSYFFGNLSSFRVVSIRILKQSIT